MIEHPQQTDRTLRDTRILTLRIWSVVGRIVIAAVIFNLMGILAPVIEFLAVGSIIAFVMSPITNWLEHHGVRSWHRFAHRADRGCGSARRRRLHPVPYFARSDYGSPEPSA